MNKLLFFIALVGSLCVYAQEQNTVPHASAKHTPIKKDSGAQRTSKNSVQKKVVTKANQKTSHAAAGSSKKSTQPVMAQKGVQHTTTAQQKTAQAKTRTSPDKPKGAYPIDRIEAIIFGTEITDIVTTSDIQRIGFDGRYHSRDDVIAERLMFQDALKYRIPMDEKAVDEYMAKVAKSMGGTIDDIKAMFAQEGYEYEEGRRQFAIMYANSQLVDYKIRSRLVVPEQTVVEYYQANPILKPTTYVLERAFIPTTPESQGEVLQNLKKFIKTGHGLMVTWYQLPEISQDDLAQDKLFITELRTGRISEPVAIAGGFEMFRIKEKTPAHPMPLEQRYRDIVDLLRRPKFEQMFADYKKELRDSASILYF